MDRFRAVICGGGIAAVEGLLRLRGLAGDSVQIDLVAPNEKLVYRPLAVKQPFAAGPPKSYPLKEISADCDAEWHKDSLAWVDAKAGVVHTGGGQAIEYDALLIAVGGREIEPYEHARTFRAAEADATYQGVLQDVEEGYSSSIAFILPVGPVWPLPIYELALMTAERARSMCIDGLQLTLITPEARPLGIFGEKASVAISERLEQAGIELYPSALATVPQKGQLLVQPQAVELRPERMIAMPRIEGPAIRGIAGGGAHGFLPIDRDCCVPQTDGRVFAAGDAAAYPIKHGGVGAQMADAAASAISALAGTDVTAEPFHPVIRGTVLTGTAPLYISARLVGTSGFDSDVYDTPPWPADEKVIAEELGPYLSQLEVRA
jgi:sulfide:quinone oxidoreductase